MFRTVAAIAILAALALGAFAWHQSRGGDNIAVAQGLAAIQGQGQDRPLSAAETGAAAPAVAIGAPAGEGPQAQGGLLEIAPIPFQGGGAALGSDLVQLPKGGEGSPVGPLQVQFPTSGIIVQGQGRATQAADKALLQIVVSAGFPTPRPLPPVPGEPGTPIPLPEKPQPVPVPVEPPSLTEADLAPIVDAMVARGVPRSDIQVFCEATPFFKGPFGPGACQMQAVLKSPNSDFIRQLLGDVARATKTHGLMIQNVSALYSVESCGPLEQKALDAAAKDAQGKAKQLAGALSVSLGPLRLAQSFGVFSPFGPGPCSPEGFERPFGPFGPPFDPSQPAEVMVVASVMVGYEIR